VINRQDSLLIARELRNQRTDVQVRRTDVQTRRTGVRRLHAANAGQEAMAIRDTSRSAEKSASATSVSSAAHQRGQNLKTDSYPRS